MPLSQPVNRTPRHRRVITADAYEREDGLWDIEARLTDHKLRDLVLATGKTRQEGEALHDLWLRVTIDLRFNVVDVEAASEAVPYVGHCEAIGPDYRKLIGLNLLKGFRKAVRDRMAGIAGCSHLSELATAIPTAAIQAFASDVIDTRDTGGDDHNPHPPFQLHGCHALRFDGEAVRQYYPRWYGYQPKENEPRTRSIDRNATNATNSG